MYVPDCDYRNARTISEAQPQPTSELMMTTFTASSIALNWFNLPFIDWPLLQPLASAGQIMPRRCRSVDARPSLRSGRTVPAPLSPPKSVRHSSRLICPCNQPKLPPWQLLHPNCILVKRPGVKQMHSNRRMQGVAMAAWNELLLRK